MNFFTRLGLIVCLCTLFAACDGEKVPDCFQNSGDIISEEISLEPFDKITVFENVELILTQGTTQSIVLETGEFLRKDISLEVKNSTLVVRNGNACNLFRKYGLTKIYVTSPNITELRSSTGLPIRSQGTLAYDNLTLYSESFLSPEAETTDGSFNLELDSQNIRVIVNGIAYFVLKGTAESLNVTIAAGDSRVEASELISEVVEVDHRGSNDIQINPLNRLTGVIRGTGDVKSYNRPDTVQVDILYKGRLLFVD